MSKGFVAVHSYQFDLVNRNDQVKSQKKIAGKTGITQLAIAQVEKIGLKNPGLCHSCGK